MNFCVGISFSVSSTMPNSLISIRWVGPFEKGSVCKCSDFFVFFLSYFVVINAPVEFLDLLLFLVMLLDFLLDTLLVFKSTTSCIPDSRPYRQLDRCLECCATDFLPKMNYFDDFKAVVVFGLICFFEPFLDKLAPALLPSSLILSNVVPSEFT